MYKFHHTLSITKENQSQYLVETNDYLIILRTRQQYKCNEQSVKCTINRNKVNDDLVEQTLRRLIFLYFEYCEMFSNISFRKKKIIRNNN